MFSHFHQNHNALSTLCKSTYYVLYTYDHVNKCHNGCILFLLLITKQIQAIRKRHDVICLKMNSSEKETFCGTSEQKIVSSSDENLLEWQMQIKVGCHVLNNNHSRSCITEACCYLKLETAISWNRNPELPERLSIMQSSHIPNALCYRILFFHLWWTPRFKSTIWYGTTLKLLLSPLIL